MTVQAVIQETVYASAARTATITTGEVYTRGRQRLHLVIDATTVTSGASVVPTIDGYDELSTKWYNLLTGVAITAVGTTVLKVGPGLSPVANACAADMLPGRIRVVLTAADAKSCTISVASHLGP